jgi:hypothetical protein
VETPDILSALKYLSLAITGLSGIWALIAKTTVEDAQGRKRLTPAGQVSVGMILISALIGMLAYGFETLAKQDAARIAADKEARQEEKARQIRVEQAAAFAAQEAHQKEIAAAEEARDKAAEADQRLLVLTNAARERDLQLDIAHRVSRGSAENLARAQVALTQLERLLNPIGLPEVTVVFALRRGPPALSGLFQRLADAARQLRANPSVAGQLGIKVTSSRGTTPLSFDFGPASALFPERAREAEIFTLLTGTGAEVAIYGNEAKVNEARRRLASVPRPSLGAFGTEGDVSFSLPTDKPESVRLSYEIDESEILIWVTGTPDSRFYRQNGDVVSVPDLERATVAIAAEDVLVPSLGGEFPTLAEARRRLVVNTVFLTAGGRQYLLRPRSSVKTSSGFPVFFTGRVGHGRTRK